MGLICDLCSLNHSNILQLDLCLTEVNQLFSPVMGCVTKMYNCVYKLVSGVDVFTNDPECLQL